MACGPGCFPVRLWMVMTPHGLPVASEGSLRTDITLMVTILRAHISPLGIVSFFVLSVVFLEEK